MAKKEEDGRFSNPHARDSEELVKELSVDPDQGLKEDEINDRQEKYGKNVIPQKEETSVVKLIIKQFKDFLILILFIAAAIAFIAGQEVDTYIILAVILFNATVGFIQEYRAEKAVQAIMSMVKHEVTVLRAGNSHTVSAEDVVMGDIILLNEGQSVPADARLLKVKNLRTGESSLTGESEPVGKETESLDEDTELGDRKNMVWKGTSVVKGTGKAVVVAIGKDTEIGKIATSLQEMEKTESNFKKKTGTLAKKMAGIAIVTSAVVFVIGYFYRDFEFQEIMLVTIATMVSAIPEGLPVVISIVLAIGANRMAKNNAIIREFTATEVMGSVTTILTDKTGTITQSILSVRRIFGADQKEYSVTGQGYEMEGKVQHDEKDVNIAESDDILKRILMIARFGVKASIQNDQKKESDDKKPEDKDSEDNKEPTQENSNSANRVEQSRRRIDEDLDRLEEDIVSDPGKQVKKDKEHLQVDIEQFEADVKKEHPEIQSESEEESEKESENESEKESEKESDEEKEKSKVSGDPTEIALRILGEKSKIHELEDFKGIQEIEDLPFNSDQKFRAKLVGLKDDSRMMLVVGAPERILELSTQVLTEDGVEKLGDDHKDTIREKGDEWAGEAFRVLSLAHKDMDSGTKEIDEEDVKDLIWTGSVAMIDPPRPQVKQAIADCRRAGIRVVMLTGDHAKTAAAIARQVGILDQKKDGHEDYPEALSEKDVAEMDDEKLDDMIRHVSVFARVAPNTKLRIAERLQKGGELIAMTGDGVNDAPALKKADVGIAMGKKGTDVAKDAAQIVLSDDNFASIVKAIREGRIVFRNVKLTSYFLLTTNFAATTTIIVTLAIGLPLPLTAVQILWVNMVTNGVMDVALATEPGHGEMMDRKPIKKNESILKWSVLPNLLLMAAIMVTLAILTFNYYLPEGEEVARTGAFFAISATQIFNVFNMRNLRQSVFQIGVFSNKWINWAFMASIVMQLAVVKVPWLQDIFGFGDIAYLDFLVITLLSSTVLWGGELYKWILRKKSPKQSSD